MKKTVITTLLISAITAVSVFATSVGEGQSKYKILEGFPDGELHLDENLTRAQFAKILTTCFETDNKQEIIPVFSDTDKNHWAYDYVNQAVKAGWINGFPDDTFRPDDTLTYEQAVSIICRIMDIGNESNYPINYLTAAMEYSINENINLLIGDTINRGQTQQLITNALEYDKGNEIFKDSYYSGGGGSGMLNATAPMIAVEMTSAPYNSADEEIYYMPYEPVTFNTEEYVSSEENVFKKTVTSPLSTFSIDTDTASYSNMRRFILNGQKIPNGSVRSEELINYFDYSREEITGEHPFSVKYTVSDCPWNTENDLVMLTVSGEELKEPKPSNIVFLIDISGSMDEYNKLPLVKRALSMLLDKLGENDKISIVTYASGTGVALEPTPATKKEKILDTVNGLMAGGGTSGASGINLAYELAEKNKVDGNNRIILCTDGDFNIGISSTGDLENLITEKRESGIYLSVLGFGMGNYKDSKMETLADKGNGNYAYIDNIREAKKVLVDDMSKTIYTIAKDVKIQAEFNPEKVSEYRLIGYENRALNNEDFENDVKDAGELGAGSTVTVLYEIKPQNGKVNSDLKYQSVTTSGSDELMNVKIRYKKPDGDTSILSEYPISADINETPDEDFMFAAAVAELSMILNDSEFKGNSTLDSVMELAKSGIGSDQFGLRNEFLQLVDILRYTKNEK